MPAYMAYKDKTIQFDTFTGNGIGLRLQRLRAESVSVFVVVKSVKSSPVQKCCFYFCTGGKTDEMDCT